MPSLTAEEAARLKPYMKLAEQLGSFAGQLTETGITAVAIDYEGAVAELNVKPLTAIALTGLLAPQLATVNMVNAPVICRERDIRVSETRVAEPSDYQTLIRVTVTTERRTRSVAGTLFGGDKPRIVEVEGIADRSRARRATCCSCATTTSRALSAISAARWARPAINIATFHLGRAAPGEDAICLVAGRPAADRRRARMRPRPPQRHPGEVAHGSEARRRRRVRRRSAVLFVCRGCGKTAIPPP